MEVGLCSECGIVFSGTSDVRKESTHVHVFAALNSQVGMHGSLGKSLTSHQCSTLLGSGLQSQEKPMLGLEKTSLFDSVIIFQQIYKHSCNELVITKSDFV